MSLCDDSAMLLEKCWLSSQQFANHFWKKWIAEYLPSLTCRAKWYDRQTPIQVGNLVIVVDPFHPRNVWLRGKVIETKVAGDGQVRSACCIGSCFTKRVWMRRSFIPYWVRNVTPTS